MSERNQNSLYQHLAELLLLAALQGLGVILSPAFLVKPLTLSITVSKFMLHLDLEQSFRSHTLLAQTSLCEKRGEK